MTFSDFSDPASDALGSELIRGLETTFDADAAATLALLYLAPLDDDGRALELASAVVKREPAHGLANLVQAYLALHYLFDEPSLHHAATGLEQLLAPVSHMGPEDPAIVGAAALLLDEIRRGLDVKSGYRPTVHLLVRSIELQPGWTLNHLRRARAFREAAQPVEARTEYDTAIANLLPLNTEQHPVDRCFDICFTGRRMRRDRMTAERDEG